MTNSIAPQIYRPPWVEARIDAFRRMTAGGLADAPTEPTSVTTFHNMTPQSAARRLERIRAADALTITADAVQSMLSPAQSKLTFVDEPIGEYHKPSTRQKLPAPSPPAPQQSGVDQLPPVVNPNAPRPTQWDGPLPELPSQQNDESAATPSPSGTTPIPVLPEPARAEDASEHVFGLPDVTGHTPGDTWDETLPNGITRTNTIPLGNGLNTVDQVIHNADGTITYSRVVSDGRGGYQRWNNDSTGTASYYNSGDPGAMGFGQHFMPGTSTSGTPDREFGTTPGWAEVVSPSYDADGNLVGYDVGVPNAEGLYDNIHYDNYGNRTVTTAAPNGHGGVTSRFFEQVDSEGNGWRIGPDDERWTMALDSHGNPVTMRTRDHEDGVLLSRIDHTGLRTDEFRGVDGEWFRDTTTPDGRITRLLRDFTRITFDADGAEIARQGRPDTRAAWEKAAGFGLAFGKGVANGALGLVEFAGALSGVNAQINLVGELFGKNPNLTTLPEAVIGLGRTVVDVAVADYRAWTTTSSELGAFLSGEQGWDETWDEASRAIGNSYNEMSKLVIGTDWTGFSEHPAETLGNAAFGVATFFLPAKGLSGAGRGGRASTALDSEPPVYRSPVRTDGQKASAGSRAMYTRRGLEFSPVPASRFTRWPQKLREGVEAELNLWGDAARTIVSDINRALGVPDLAAAGTVVGSVRFDMATPPRTPRPRSPGGETSNGLPKNSRGSNAYPGSNGRQFPWPSKAYQIALPPGKASKSIEEIRRSPNVEDRWRNAEQNARERYGAGPERPFNVSKSGDSEFPIPKDTIRKVDAPVDRVDGGVTAIEVKFYQRYNGVEIVSGRRVGREVEVPLSDHIRGQIAKDVWLRANKPGYDPVWEFQWAGPSQALHDELVRAGIRYVWHL